MTQGSDRGPTAWDKGFASVANGTKEIGSDWTESEVTRPMVVERQASARAENLGALWWVGEISSVWQQRHLAVGGIEQCRRVSVFSFGQAHRKLAMLICPMSKTSPKSSRPNNLNRVSS
jgi:hypothetical protein